MRLCCMPQLTCFYNPAGFICAFKMFILISNYVYSMLQLPLFSLFYFMFYTYPTFCLFLCQGQIFFLGVDSLSSKSSAYFEFFVQEMMIITDSSLAVSFDFRLLGRRLVFRNLLYNIRN